MIGLFSITPSYKSAVDDRYMYIPSKAYSAQYVSTLLPPAYEEKYRTTMLIEFPVGQETSSFTKDLGLSESVNPDFKRRREVYEAFTQSFLIHKGDRLPNSGMKEFEKIAEVLCTLPIKESLVQYSSIDKMIDFLIVLNDGIKLSIGKFMDEEDTEDLVEFSIYNKKRIILSGETDIENFVAKILKIHKYNRQY